MSWGKLVVEHQHVQTVCFHQQLQLLGLAFADEERRIGRDPLLQALMHNLGSGCFSQGMEFLERFFGGDSFAAVEVTSDQPRTLCRQACLEWLSP